MNKNLNNAAPPVVLSIAGFDPSSGAGVSADVKTAAAHDCYAATCITALTVQSTRGVSYSYPVHAQLVKDTLNLLASDLEFAAVRIGMLATAEVARAVADFLERQRPSNIVLDPVIRSSSDAVLLDEAGVEVVRTRMLPLATVVTPNIDEATTLTGIAIATLADVKRAAHRLRELGAANAVVTGGHLASPVDLLLGSEGEHLFEGAKIQSSSTHGTGCAFATAIACELAHGRTVAEAVAAAKIYVRSAIESAYPLGRGIGPVNHFGQEKLT